MNAGQLWDSIQNDPTFQSAPQTEKDAFAKKFFDTKIAPNVPKEHLASARGDFFRNAFSAPEAPSEISKSEAAMSAFGEALGTDIPVIGKAVGALRKDIPAAISETAGALAPESKTVQRGAAALGTAIGTTGEMLPKTMGDAAIMALSGPLWRGAKMMLPRVSSFLTQISPEVVTKAVDRTVQGAKVLGNTELRTPMALEDAVKGFHDSIQAARKAAGEALEKSLDDAVMTSTKRVDTRKVVVDAVQQFEKNNIVMSPVKASGAAEGARVLPKEVEEALTALYNDSLSFEDAHKLKKTLGQLIDKYGKTTGDFAISKDEMAILSKAKAGLNHLLYTAEPALYGAPNKKFEALAKAWDNLAEYVGRAGSHESQAARISRMMKKGTAERKLVENTDKLAAQVEESLGNAVKESTEKVMDTVAAQEFAPVINPTLKQSVWHTGGGLIPTALTGITAGAVPALGALASTVGLTSPRLHSLGLRAMYAPIGRTQIRGLAPTAAGALLSAYRKPEGPTAAAAMTPEAERLLRSREQR